MEAIDKTRTGYKFENTVQMVVRANAVKRCQIGMVQAPAQKSLKICQGCFSSLCLDL